MPCKRLTKEWTYQLAATYFESITCSPIPPPPPSPLRRCHPHPSRTYLYVHTHHRRSISFPFHTMRPMFVSTDLIIVTRSGIGSPRVHAIDCSWAAGSRMEPPGIGGHIRTLVGEGDHDEGHHGTPCVKADPRPCLSCSKPGRSYSERSG